MCDQYYQDMDPIVKDAWRFCVKKRGMSGYGLFMKECLCLLIKGYNFPRTCSPSGGYNCLTVDPGDEVPPLEGFIGQAQVRYRCLGPPDWRCVPSPIGAYTDLDACNAVCHPTWPWKCQDAPTWNCLRDPDGTFETQEECELTCTPPENVCNDCDPTLPDTMYVTISGLANSFAPYNGETPVHWVSSCLWRHDSLIWPGIDYMNLWYTPTVWKITFSLWPSLCTRTVGIGPTTPCNPYDSLWNWEVSCNDSGCPNTSSCENSVGALYSVSPTPT